QARHLVTDPALQVFPGRAMHCVLNQTTAMCQLREGPDHTATPDVDDCRPRCPNIARTDTDIEALRTDLRRIADRLDDPLAPAPPATTPSHSRCATAPPNPTSTTSSYAPETANSPTSPTATPK